MEYSGITATYTGMAGRTMHRAVGLTVERGLAAVTGHGKEDAGTPSGFVAEGTGKLMAGAGVAPASLPELTSHRIRRRLS